MHALHYLFRQRDRAIFCTPTPKHIVLGFIAVFLVTIVHLINPDDSISELHRQLGLDIMQRIDTHSHAVPPGWRRYCMELGWEKPDGMAGIPVRDEMFPVQYVKADRNAKGMDHRRTLESHGARSHLA